MKRIIQNKHISVYPACGLPTLQHGHTLPKKLVELYQLYGGMGIFDGELCRTYISTPHEFISANEWSYEKGFLEELKREDENYHLWKSHTWYKFAYMENGDFIVIDLHEDKLGWCYACNVGNYDYDEDGDMPIIAKSPKEFIERTLQMDGEMFYWEEKSFKPYGNVFD